MGCCMSEYLQKELEERYKELCQIKERLVSHDGDCSREDSMRNFIEKCDEIEDVIREQRSKEMRASIIRKARG